MADPSPMVGCRKRNCKGQRAERVQIFRPLDYILNRVASGPSSVWLGLISLISECFFSNMSNLCLRLVEEGSVRSGFLTKNKVLPVSLLQFPY